MIEDQLLTGDEWCELTLRQLAHLLDGAEGAPLGVTLAVSACALQHYEGGL